jgi:hypothetical protein
MAEKKYRLVGWWWLSSSNSIWWKVGAGAWTELAFSFASTGNWYMERADGSAQDLTYQICVAISAVAGAALTRSTSMDTGIITLSWAGASTLQLRFDHPTTPNTNNNSYFLHNAWRMTATQTTAISITAGGTSVGTRCHGYGLYPLRYLMSDISEWVARVSQSVPDSGNPQTLRSAMLEQYHLGIRIDRAYPRAALFNEFHALVDFMDNASSGRPFYVYPDKTVNTDYSDVAAPYGRRPFVLDKDSASWRPEPAVANFYKVFDVGLKCWLFVE